MSNFVARTLQWILIKFKTHSNCSRNYEIHFEYLFFFVENNVFVLFAAEKSGPQSKSNVIEETSIAVLLWVEKSPKVVKNVVEEVVNDNIPLDGIRQRSNELIVAIKMCQPIVHPIVFEVLINLTIKIIWQGLILSKSGQECEPII